MCVSFHALTDAFHTHQANKEKQLFQPCPLFPLYYSELKIYMFSPSIVLEFYTFVVLFVWFLYWFFFIYNVTHSLTVLRVSLCGYVLNKKKTTLCFVPSLNVQHFLPCILHIALQMCHLWERAGNGRAGLMVGWWECELL